ncbi:pyridoxal-phosphate dependent enzyme [Penicillium chermesinum]|nr:pyridoxal-phosphate dependent enzyme [Penicillium chermesinum]
MSTPAEQAQLLTAARVQAAYTLIQPYIHKTPVLTNKTLNSIASTPQTADALAGTPFAGQTPAQPRIRFHFKCENLQRIGAFKARGAFHALLRLIEDRGEEEVQRRGVITHSSGNHAQALALAASTLGVPAYIVMPEISTTSKIAGTRAYGAQITFSGSTSVEREAVVAEIQSKTDWEELDAVITPIGGGGLNAGVATFFSDKTTKVFGAEPSFQGADDCRRGLEAGQRIEKVSTLTIGDGLRTPVGLLNWEVISDQKKVEGVYAVTEEQIKSTMKLVLERMKVVVEPSAVVGLAVCLFDEDFRRRVEKEGGEEGWDIGVVFSGGNTTVEAIAKLFG